MPARWNPAEKGRYWVVGGRYIDMTFQHRSWSEMIGPFDTLYDAEAVWRRISFAYAHEARVRFTILRDAEPA